MFTVPVGPGDRISTANSPQTAADPPSSSSDNTVAVVGGVVVVIAVSIVVAITILVAIALLRGRRAEFRPKQKYICNAPCDIIHS